MKKEKYERLAAPKLLVPKATKKAATKPTTIITSNKKAGSNTPKGLTKLYKPIAPKKKPALTRNAFMSKKSKASPQKREWEGVKNTIIAERATTMVPHTEWVDVKAGSEVTEGGKEVKGKEFSSGMQQKKVTTMKNSGLAGWTDAYTGERILKRSDIQIDHTVPIDRVIKSGAFKKNVDAGAFGVFMENLVITKASTNKAKGAKDLSQFTPTHEPAKYAKRYGNVMSKHKLVMTHGEDRAYKRMTGTEYDTEKTPNPVQHILDMQRGEPIAESQTRRDDFWMMKARKK